MALFVNEMHKLHLFLIYSQLEGFLSVFIMSERMHDDVV